MTWNYTPLIDQPEHTAVTVRRGWTVPAVLPDSALARRGEPVLATGYLIVLLENATWQVAAQHVPESLALLGHTGRYQHTAPAVHGQVLDIAVTCTGGRGSHTWWHASAHVRHTSTQVGVLQHTLVATGRDKFHQRLAQTL